MARYLLAASPLAGHVLPMLQIAVDLQRRGHSVRLITGQQYHRAVHRAGVTPVALPPEAQPQSTARGSALFGSPSMIDLWRSGRADMRSVFIDPLGAQYRTLHDELQRHQADAALVDVAFTGALPLLLSDRKRPAVAVCGVGPLMLSSADTPPFGVGWQPAPGFDYRQMNWFVHHVLFADIQTRLNTALRRAGVGPAPVFLTDWPKLADRVIQLTAPAAEYPRRDLSESVVFAGPVTANPVAAGELPQWWPEVQRTSRTVVHVTQGTWDNRDHGQLIRPTLQALAGRDDLLVVATTGLPEQPAFSGPVPANARITDYLPYAALLPVVDVMITNGGYGGVQQALMHGIPLVVAGRTADKPETAARVAFTGAGIDLKTARPTSAAIAGAVQRILTDGSYLVAAQRISREMVAASPLDTIAGVLAGLHSVGLDRPLATGA
ncbi:MAG: nucleotide disphospho-sugar-binding domain-containing protein [Mycobacterium sp.]